MSFRRLVEEWLKNREEELKVAVKRSRYGKKIEDTRIWPFEANTAYFIWRNAISKSGFDKRFQYNNGLRRFTRTCLESFQNKNGYSYSR